MSHEDIDEFMANLDFLDDDSVRQELGIADPEEETQEVPEVEVDTVPIEANVHRLLSRVDR